VVVKGLETMSIMLKKLPNQVFHLPTPRPYTSAQNFVFLRLKYVIRLDKDLYDSYVCCPLKLQPLLYLYHELADKKEWTQCRTLCTVNSCSVKAIIF
jgi:hypothetical protein